MTKFTRWSGIAHSILIKSHRKTKLGHAQEVLAAYLGHRTYASLRTHDLAVLQNQAKYVLVDPEKALNRAAGLDIPLTADDWLAVEHAIRPSGISGETWLVGEQSMHLAARLTLENSGDRRLYDIAHRIGLCDGIRTTDTRCHSSPGEFPEKLKFTVEGEVRTGKAEAYLAIPVVCEVAFPRVGKRFYASGELLSVEQSGPPTEYEPEEEQMDFSYLSESDD
jgi:hypothetical protein